MDIMKAAGRSSQSAALPVNALRRQRARRGRPGRACPAAARAMGLPGWHPITGRRPPCRGVQSWMIGARPTAGVVTTFARS
jgi:hypothetical protein